MHYVKRDVYMDKKYNVPFVNKFLKTDKLLPSERNNIPQAVLVLENSQLPGGMNITSENY